ncbi:hypothetical protein [Glycomyces amatae]|nr:hypothetical protein [Glycomyces amatae]
MNWIIRNIALAVAMALGRRAWRAYRRHRAADKTAERAAIASARR